MCVATDTNWEEEQVFDRYFVPRSRRGTKCEASGSTETIESTDGIAIVGSPAHSIDDEGCCWGMAAGLRGGITVK